MKTATRISEMQKFHFGTKIECADGEAGSLTYIVFDDTTRLTYPGLKQGHLFSKTYNLPYDTVVEATGEGILLHIPRAELAAAREETVQGVMLDRRSVVERAGTQDRGTLRLVAVHPKIGALAYVVVHHLRPQQEVEATRFDLTPLHIDLKGISICVLDSVLYLDGSISSQRRAEIAEDQVIGASGLLEINNKINA